MQRFVVSKGMLRLASNGPLRIQPIRPHGTMAVKELVEATLGQLHDGSSFYMRFLPFS